MKNPMINFYDTSSLLLIADKLLAESIDNVIVFSSITLQELETIKTSTNKDSHIKYTARQLLHWLDENPSKYICHVYHTYMENFIKHKELELTRIPYKMWNRFINYDKNKTFHK